MSACLFHIVFEDLITSTADKSPDHGPHLILLSSKVPIVSRILHVNCCLQRLPRTLSGPQIR